MAKTPMIVKITWADNAQPAFKSGLESIPIQGETLKKIGEEAKVTTYRWMTDQGMAVAQSALQSFVQTQDMINAMTGRQIVGVSVEAEAPPAPPAAVAPTVPSGPATAAAEPWWKNRLVWVAAAGLGLLAVTIGSKRTDHAAI